MANPLRAKSTNYFVWALLALLIVGLIGFGSTSLRGSTRSIGSVGDEQVMIADYARDLNQALQRLSQQTGQTVTIEMARQFGLDRAVLDQSFALAAQDGEARRIGLSIGDRKVQAALLATPAFQGVAGGFDQEAYRYALENAGLSPADYDAILRKENARRLLQSGVISGVAPSGAYVNAIMGFLRETRDIRWARLDADNLSHATRAPAEDEITAWYDAHPDAYTAPETKNITYAMLTPEDVLGSIEVDPARIKALYDERATQYNAPERRLVERLVYPSDADAQAAWDALQAGSKTFEDLVTDRGVALSDIDMGDVERSALSAEAAVAVFAMTEPGVVGPVQSSLGPAIFRLNGILQAHSTPLDDVRDELSAELAMDQARRKIADMTTEIDDLLAAGATLEELGTETAMTIGTIGFTATTQEGPAAYDAFRTAAAAVTAEDFPQIGELSDGGIFALRLDETTPPTLRPLDDVRDQVIADWRADQTMQRLRNLAATLKSQIEGGTDFASVGLSATDAKGLTRQSQTEGTPPAFATEVFATDAGNVALIDGADAVFLAQVVSVTPFDPAAPENAQILQQLRTQSALQIGQDMFDQYVRALQDEAGVTLNQGALASVQSGFH